MGTLIIRNEKGEVIFEDEDTKERQKFEMKKDGTETRKDYYMEGLGYRE